MDPRLDPNLVKIAINDEINEIRAYLAAIGEEGVSTTESMKTFTNASDNPIAKHKVKAAKLRKKKRKNGGPR